MTDVQSGLTLAHLDLEVADLGRSEHFYHRILGLPVTSKADSLLIHWPGGLLILHAAERPASSGFHFGFRVASDALVDEWFARFASSQIAIDQLPSDRGFVYVGRVRDPDGYGIEIYSERS